MKIAKNCLKNIGIVFVFINMTFICANISALGLKENMTLNGVWVGDDNIELIFENYNFKYSFLRGTYTINGNNITIITTQIYTNFDSEFLDIASGWFTKDELETEINNMLWRLVEEDIGLTEEDVLEGVLHILFTIFQ